MWELKILATWKEYNKEIFNKKITNDLIKIFKKDLLNDNLKNKLEIIIKEKFLENIKKLPKKTKRELKRLSINPERLEIFMTLAHGVICNIWENIFNQELWIDFSKPDLVLFDWSIEIEWDIFSWEAAYHKKSNKVLINTSLILWLINHDIINSDIWFTLILAHEIWHSIQKQLGLSISQTKSESEHHADFIAWYSLKEMEKLWLLDEQDLKDSLHSFGRLWDICEIWKHPILNPNIWWDSKTRKWNLFKWYLADNTQLKKSLVPQIKKLIDKYKKKFNNIDLKKAA